MTKKCSQCEEVKELTEFYIQNKKKASGESYIYYNPCCKECIKENTVKWQQDPKNRKSLLDSKRKTNKRPKHKITLKKTRERRRESGYFKEYYDKNKEKFKEYRVSHEGKKHEITEQEWINCKMYFDNTCAYCGITEKGAKEKYDHNLHMEHAINDGANDISNCIPSCRKCNSEKWTRDFDEWYNIQNVVFTQERCDKILKWMKEDCKLV